MLHTFQGAMIKCKLTCALPANKKVNTSAIVVAQVHSDANHSQVT